MSLAAVNGRHIRLICLHWARYAVRSGSGLVFLMIALVFGLSVAQMVLTPIEMGINRVAQGNRQDAQDVTQEIVDEVMKLGRPVVQWALGIKTDTKYNPLEAEAIESPADPWTTFLLDKDRALLSIIFLIMLFGMPLLIGFLAFNQVAGDVQSLGLRYLLLRTERVNIFFGRFLGTAIFSTIVIAIIIATITFYLGVKIRIYPALALVVWGFHGFLALSVLMLPYIAVCSMISASVDSPFLSLVLSQLVIGGVLLFAFIGKLTWAPAVNIRYALPWGVQNHLLHPELTHSVGTALLCLGYTIVFLLLGYYRFETRDL